MPYHKEQSFCVMQKRIQGSESFLNG